MQCREAEPRLVAMQDGELSASEDHQVREHLAACGSCRQLERRLRLATPFPGLVVPAHVRARLEDRVDTAVILSLAEGPAASESAWRRTARWLDRDAQVPRSVVLAATALLVCSLGWGLTSWWSLASLQADLAGRNDSSIAPAHATAAAEIPAEQFRPASYTPEEEEVFH